MLEQQIRIQSFLVVVEQSLLNRLYRNSLDEGREACAGVELGSVILTNTSVLFHQQFKYCNFSRKGLSNITECLKCF